MSFSFYTFAVPSSFVLDDEFCGNNSFWRRSGAGYPRGSIVAHWMLDPFRGVRIDTKIAPEESDYRDPPSNTWWLDPA